MFQKLGRSPSAEELLLNWIAGVTGVRGSESAETAGIYCDFDATTRFDRLSNASAFGGPVSLTRHGALPILLHLRTGRHRVNWFGKQTKNAAEGTIGEVDA